MEAVVLVVISGDASNSGGTAMGGDGDANGGNSDCDMC